METGKILKSVSYTLEQTTEKITRAMLYEQGPIGSTVIFNLECTNIPIGSVISFECPELGPQPPIVLQPTDVTTYPSFSAGMESYVPADFAGTLYYSVTLSEEPAEHAHMEMQAIFPADRN